MAGDAAMLTKAVDSYIAMRRVCGFAFQSEGTCLRSFAAFSDAKGDCHVRSGIAVEWASQARSTRQRARRLGIVIRFARYAHAEDERHEVPAPMLGSENSPRPVPYIFSREDIQGLIQAASQSGYRTLRRATYSTLFGLLACTGLRLSEAIHLRYSDITADGLVVRCTKFRKSRLVVLHTTARAALERYLTQRRPYAPLDDHVFISLRRKPLLVSGAESAFRSAARKIGLRSERGLPRPTIHALRHTFAVRALEACPDDRDRITQHMLALSTYLGHGHVGHTYWYLEATPQLMRDISQRCEHLVTGGHP
jgi:integrase/recombinase XerD